MAILQLLDAGANLEATTKVSDKEKVKSFILEQLQTLT